jgi:hypothetical protein
VREKFGTWRAVDVTSEALGTHIEALREDGYSKATVNRRMQLLGQAITGHRTDSMFRRYAIVNEDQKRSALAKTQQHLDTSASRKVVAMGGK